MALLRKFRVVLATCLVLALVTVVIQYRSTSDISVSPVVKNGIESDQKQKELRSKYVNSSTKQESSFGVNEKLNLNKSSERSAQAPPSSIERDVSNENVTSKKPTQKPELQLVKEAVLDKNSTSQKSNKTSEKKALVKDAALHKNSTSQKAKRSERRAVIKAAFDRYYAAQKSKKREREFMDNVKRVLEKLPKNSTYGGALTNVTERAKSRGPGWETNELESLHDSQFLNYMKCPTSVRKKILTNKVFANRFIPEVPILAWNEHYTPDEYQRLKGFDDINGWSRVNQSRVADTLHPIDTPGNKYLFDTSMVNGSIPDDHKCIRCAVVGNGGILNGSKMGKEIDANDYVFRVNTALTKGHEEDVGNRTSFYCFAMTTLLASVRRGFKTGFIVPSDKDIRYVFFADISLTYTYLSEVLIGRKPKKRPVVTLPKKITPANMKMVHPDFQRYIKFNWVKSPKSKRTIYRPTTGGIMLLLALHTCDEVNVYGFGGSYKKFSEHYYDRTFERHRNYANHDTTAENKLWEELHQEGLINMYKRE